MCGAEQIINICNQQQRVFQKENKTFGRNNREQVKYKSLDTSFEGNKGAYKLIIINVSSQAEMNIQRLNVRIDQVHNKYQLNFLNPCRIDEVVHNFVAISSEF